MVTGAGVCKLADFGTAKKISKLFQKVQGNIQRMAVSLKGTTCWMAPEAIKQQKNLGRACDIWSLGCTVLEMATGKSPWPQVSNKLFLVKIFEGDDSISNWKL